MAGSHSGRTAEAVIKWHNRCLRSVREAGLGQDFFKGQPDTIPVSETDFIFSAITEEMGVIYALCLILICVSCYVMFLNIAMELRNNFIS